MVKSLKFFLTEGCSLLFYKFCYIHIYYIYIYIYICMHVFYLNDSRIHNFSHQETWSRPLLIFWSGLIKFVFKVFCWKIFVDAVLYIFYVNSSLLSAFLFVSIFVAVCHIYWFYEKSLCNTRPYLKAWHI